MIAWILQAVTVSVMNLRNLPARWGSSLVAVIGIAGVVLVLVGILSMARGFEAALTDGTAPENVIVMRGSATSELDSGIGADEANVIAEAPGVAKDADGNALASPELFVVVDVPRKSTGTSSNVPLRGVSPAAFGVRESFRIIEGRNFTPGMYEIIVGRGASGQFAGLAVGDSVKWGQNSWQVVGVFETGGAADSEIWADARAVQDAYRRGNSYNTLRVKLESADSFAMFKDALTTNPQLNVRVLTEREYYADQARMLSGFISGIGVGVAFLMGLGAMFGAVNTMSTAVANRSREIATLRALGFGKTAVMVSVLTEAIVLGIAGGLLGGALAWALFNGYQVSTLSWSSFSQVTFAFRVTPELLVDGASYSLLLGLLGGILPAFRAVRRPVATALRQL
ncbi:MAG TPA: ABC transporter permease [Gammaproteobacteria bacterium]